MADDSSLTARLNREIEARRDNLRVLRLIQGAEDITRESAVEGVDAVEEVRARLTRAEEIIATYATWALRDVDFLHEVAEALGRLELEVRGEGPELPDRPYDPEE